MLIVNLPSKLAMVFTLMVFALSNKKKNQICEKTALIKIINSVYDLKYTATFY